MSSDIDVRPDGITLTVRLPLHFRRRGGRKQVVTPAGQRPIVVERTQIDSTLVKALARAHRWQSMLESGAYGSIAELATAERINSSYLARVLRLTLLAPDLVESILGGRHDPERVTLDTLMNALPIEWDAQRARI
jgi:hypothetical protein